MHTVNKNSRSHYRSSPRNASDVSSGMGQGYTVWSLEDGRRRRRQARPRCCDRPPFVLRDHQVSLSAVLIGLVAVAKELRSSETLPSLSRLGRWVDETWGTTDRQITYTPSRSAVQPDRSTTNTFRYPPTSLLVKINALQHPTSC